MLTTIEKALLLQKFDLLRFATTDHLIQLAEMCSPKTVAVGEILFQQGEPAGKLYLLVQGRAVMEGSDEVLIPGMALNLWPCLAGVEHPVTCRCAQECKVLTLAVPDLLDLLGSDAELCLAVLRYSAMQQAS